MTVDKYATYQPTGVPWLCSVPEHWTTEALRFAVTFNDETLPETTDPDLPIDYVDISCVSYEGGVERVEKLTFEKAPSRARRIVRDGDTIVSTVRTYLRAVATIRNPTEGLIVSTGFVVLRPSKKLDPGFLGYFAKSQGFVGAVVAQSVGVSYPATNASDVVRLPITYPPLDEQRAIVRFLDAKMAEIDALIAKKQRLLELLAEQRSALITKAVTKGLNPNAPMKPSVIPWLGDVPTHWDIETPIKFLVSSAGGSTPSTANAIYWDGSIPWVTPKDMKRDDLNDSEDHVSDEALRETSLRLIEQDAVLIVVRGMILAHTFPVAINRVRVTLNQDMKALCPDRRLASEFLAWFLRGVSKHVLSLVETSAHGTKALRTDQWDQLVVPLMPIDEQTAIVEYIVAKTAKIDLFASTVEQQISQLREYRSALITDAVTGQIDVRGWQSQKAAA